MKRRNDLSPVYVFPVKNEERMCNILNALYEFSLKPVWFDKKAVNEFITNCPVDSSEFIEQIKNKHLIFRKVLLGFVLVYNEESVLRVHSSYMDEDVGPAILKLLHSVEDTTEIWSLDQSVNIKS